MQQPSLFGPVAAQIPNTLYLYEKPCGVTATLGPRVEWDGGYNESITCNKCQRLIGERSTNVRTAGRT